jgi:hypothetical protein
MFHKASRLAEVVLLLSIVLYYRNQGQNAPKYDLNQVKATTSPPRGIKFHDLALSLTRQAGTIPDILNFPSPHSDSHIDNMTFNRILMEELKEVFHDYRHRQAWKHQPSGSAPKGIWA